VIHKDFNYFKNSKIIIKITVKEGWSEKSKIAIVAVIILD